MHDLEQEPTSGPVEATWEGCSLAVGMFGPEGRSPGASTRDSDLRYLSKCCRPALNLFSVGLGFELGPHTCRQLLFCLSHSASPFLGRIFLR
jgi:hypothetical protein